MRVDVVMTKTVVTIRADATIAAVIAKLVDHKISGLPVLNELGRLVGMVTEGDLLRRVELGTHHAPPKWLGFLHRREKAAQDFVHDHTRRVVDVMTRDPISVDVATPLDTVVDLMEAKHIRRLPVVANGGLVGIISRSDLIRLLGQIMQAASAVQRPDAAVEADVRSALQRHPWFRHCKVTIAVTDGLVRFKGVVDDATTQAAMRVAAETVPGVTGVKMAVAFARDA